MTEKLTAEQRAAQERDLHFADEALQEIQQYAKLREVFPDLDDKEIAHRMATTVAQVRRLRRNLEK